MDVATAIIEDMMNKGLPFEITIQNGGVS